MGMLLLLLPKGRIQLHAYSLQFKNKQADSISSLDIGGHHLRYLKLQQIEYQESELFYAYAYLAWACQCGRCRTKTIRFADPKSKAAQLHSRAVSHLAENHR